MKALALVRVDLRRLVRWRANVFFLLILPLLLILLLGSVFGGAEARLGVVTAGSGALGEELAAALEGRENIDAERYPDEAALLAGVEEGAVNAGVVVPSGYTAALRAGEPQRLRYFVRPDSLGEELRPALEAAVAEQSAQLRAAALLEREGLAAPGVALERARAAAAAVPPVTVDVSSEEGDAYPEPEGFGASASGQLLLFVFLTSLNASVALIDTRRLGIARRILSTPTRLGSVLLGVALGRLGIALVQASLIMVGAALIFGVGWGDPAAAAALVLAFCLAASGAAMLLGAAAENVQQAGSLALLLGLGLAALGGSMVPLEVFPDTVRTVARVTPHAWGNEAFLELDRRGGGLGDVLREVGVLLGFAAAAYAAATWRLRRVIAA